MRKRSGYPSIFAQSDKNVQDIFQFWSKVTKTLGIFVNLRESEQNARDVLDFLRPGTKSKR